MKELECSPKLIAYFGFSVMAIISVDCETFFKYCMTKSSSKIFSSVGGLFEPLLIQNEVRPFVFFSHDVQ